MASKVRSVSVVFQAFTDKFEKKIDSASSKAAGFGKKVLAGVAGFVAARTTISQFSQAFSDLTKIGDTAKELQVSPQFLQGIDLATEQLGENFEKAKDVIREFNIRMGEARTGAGPAVNGLRLLNLTIEDFAKLNPEEGFLKVADALSKIEDPQLKLFTAGELFGGAGEDMIGLLNEGKEGLEEFIKRAEELSGPISIEDLDRIKEADIAVKEMGRSWESIIQQLAVELAPIVQSLADMFTELGSIIRGIGDTWTAIQQGLEAELLDYYRVTGELTQQEYEDALALVIPDKKPRKLDFETREKKTIQEVKAKITNIPTFVESLSAGSAAAFRAMNPAQRVDVQREMVNEQKKSNTLLEQMIEELPKFNEASI